MPLHRSLRTGLLALLLLACSFSLPAAQFTARVIGVSDGDTVKVLDAQQETHTIRLLGIDAPEKAQPFGARAKQSLSDLAYGQTLTIEWYKRDRYGRIVGKLLDGRGEDLNLAQVRRGMAWHYKEYRKEQPAKDRDIYADAEQAARHQGRGLWADAQAEAPWEYRRQKRATRNATSQ